MATAARIARNELIAAEAAALVGGVPDADGVADCDRVDRVGRSAYLQRGIRVLQRASTVSDLRDAVAAAAPTIDSERFRVDLHDPARRMAASGSHVAISFAEVLDGDPDLSTPEHHFLVVVRQHEAVFGEIVTETDASYRVHDGKPWTTSSSLDSRFSRALINLVPDATSVLDPCCGAGSIVLEAASLGLVAHGVDWKTPMVGMTRENLAHFGYVGSSTQADSRTHVQHADAIVTDLPYGHGITTDEPTIRAILEQCATLAPRGVFVAPADSSVWLEAAGYTDIEVHTVMKRRGFTRWIHVVRSAALAAVSPRPR